MSWRRKSHTDEGSIIHQTINDGSTDRPSSRLSNSGSRSRISQSSSDDFGSSRTTSTSGGNVTDDVIFEKPGSVSWSSRPARKNDGWGTRHTLALLGFTGFMVSYAMRVNLSIAIVAMVTNNASSLISNSTDACPVLEPLNPTNVAMQSTTSPDTTEGEFKWSGEDQGIILGAFFWGYVILQIPGGMLSERIGGKWPFGIGMLVTAIFTLLTPWAARAGKETLIICRIIQGLGEGITNPAMHAILARWVPPLERSRLGALIYLGSQAGTVITLPLCGYLISTNFLGGWPSVFYLMGILGIIWFICWAIFVFDTPRDHPRIQPKELSYIQHSIGLQLSKTKVPTPWRKILTSMPVLAILVAQTGHGWGLYTLLTELPTYLKDILRFDMKTNGFISAIPYLATVIFGAISSWMADYLIEQKLASTSTVRKGFCTIAHICSAVFMVGAAYAGCDRLLVVALITTSIGLSGAYIASFQINHIDIASNHAGVMMGITNSFANLMGILAPYVAGEIINDGSSLSNWRLIFLIVAAVMTFDNIFYVIFASGEEQSWNRGSGSPDVETPSHQKRGECDDDRQPLLTSVTS